jgi:hypothetical protein
MRTTGSQVWMSWTVIDVPQRPSAGLVTPGLPMAVKRRQPARPTMRMKPGRPVLQQLERPGVEDPDPRLLSGSGPLPMANGSWPSADRRACGRARRPSRRDRRTRRGRARLQVTPRSVPQRGCKVVGVPLLCAAPVTRSAAEGGGRRTQGRRAPARVQQSAIAAELP